MKNSCLTLLETTPSVKRRAFLKQAATAAAALVLAPGSKLMSATEANILDIGGEAQLFLDDWVVERITGLKRTLHQPEKKGPILEADGRPWEHGGVQWIVRDTSGRFHMPYRILWWDESLRASSSRSPGETFRSLTGYAVSDDGIRWHKPVLGLVEGPIGFRRAPESKWKEGVFLEPTGLSKENSFGYPVGSVRDMGQFGGVSEPSRRYLIEAGGVYFSREVPDVVKDPSWRQKLTAVEGERKSRRAGIAGWDEKAQLWFAVGQSVGWQGRDEGRNIAGWASKDLKSWSDQQIILPVAADESRKPDHWVEYYGMGAYRAGDVWLGTLHVYHTDRSSPQYSHPTSRNTWMKGTVDIRLMVSRDPGRSWQRVADKQVWLPHHEQENGYDRQIYTTTPVRVGDELWTYYEAWDGDHITWNRDNTPYYRDRQRIPRTARAVLRWDGYVSLDAGEEAGQLLTHPVRFQWDQLTVNLFAPQGRLRAELQDQSGKPIHGFTAAQCLPVRGDGVALPLRWRNHPNLRALSGRAVRLRFELRNGSLYSFRVFPQMVQL